MNARDVEKFYNDFKTSISTISRLEKKMLKESYSYEKWYDTMQQKSVLLRKVYAENAAEYTAVIQYAIDHPNELDDEVYAQFLTHIDFFLSENYRDYGVTVPVLKMMRPHWEKKGIPGKLLDCDFFLGVSLANSHYYGEACNAFEMGLESFSDIMDCPEPYWIYRMMCTVYYRLLAYSCLERFNEEILLKYYYEAKELWSDERIPEWILPTKKKTAFYSIIRNLVCYAVAKILDQNIVPSDELIGIIIEELYYQKNEVEPEMRLCSAEVVYYKYMRTSGKCSAKDYEKYLINLVETNRKYFEVGYSFGSWKFITLFDDELSEAVFSTDKLFFMNQSFAYVNYALVELLCVSNDITIKEEISYGIYKYFMALPPLDGDGYIDTFLYPIMSVFVAHCIDENMIVDCIINLLVHRQISTAIHVTMVAKLCRIIVEYMSEKHPEYFIGTLGIRTISEVVSNKDKLGDFAYKAGLVHDIGKLICSDVVTLQNRKILNEEFSRIKVHPVAGSSILMNSACMSDYAYIALCHHIFNDGSKGYPERVSLPDSFVRIFIEIVTVCDSIDAMSDTLGRNYATAKPIEKVLEELKAEVDTRYSKRVVEDIVENPSLVEQIVNLLYKERIDVNYDIYKRFVMPETHFRPEDEKYIAPMNVSVIESNPQIFDFDDISALELYEKCRDYSYIILDGSNEIFGTVLGESIDNKMIIRQIYVSDASRRKGYGTMLLKYIENQAHEDGLSVMYIKEVVRGHFDKFAWHNGFSASASDVEGWMIKKL